MTTIAIGNSVTLTIPDGGSVAVSSNYGFFTSTLTPTVGDQSVRAWGPEPIRRVFGPFRLGGTLVIASQTAEVMYDPFIAGNTNSIAVSTVPVVGKNLPQTGTGALNASRYTRLKAALDRVRNKTGYAKIGLVGDSTRVGAYARTTSAGAAALADARSASPTVYMTAALSSFDLPVIAASFVGNQNVTLNSSTTPAYDPRVSYGAGAWGSGVTATVAGSFQQNSTDTIAMTFLPTEPVDRFDVYYPTNAGLGSFQITRTGDTGSGTISQAGTAGVAKYTFSGALGNTNALNIARVAGGAYIMAVDAYNSAEPSVRMFNIGWNGGVTADWINTATAFAALPGLLALGLDAVNIQPGINEWNTSVPPATFQANLLALVDALLPTTDVWLTTPYPSQNSSFTLAVQKQYVDAIYAVAALRGLAVNDIWRKVGSYERANSFGYYSNNLHPNLQMYRFCGEAEAAFLLSL